MGFQPMRNINHGRDARATIAFSAITPRSLGSKALAKEAPR